MCQRPCYRLQTDMKTKTTSVTIELPLYLFHNHLPTNQQRDVTK